MLSNLALIHQEFEVFLALFPAYYIGISSKQNILECATKVARTLWHLRKGKELQNLTMYNCVQHLSIVVALSL